MLHGDADARVDGVFGDGAGEVGLALAAGEGEPGGGFVVVFDEGLLDAGGDDGVDGEVGVALPSLKTTPKRSFSCWA